MSKYKNLPGFNIDLLDGNLRIDNNVQGPVVLVIGTAYRGPTGAQYLVSDTNVASNLYGSDSPLIQKMSEVIKGGAKNVILYRIGGAPAEIRNLFGQDTLIATAEETSSANTKYKVFIGASPKNDGNKALIVFNSSGEIVYSNVVGSEIDLGEVTVVGFDNTFPYSVGTVSAPVLFRDVISSLSQTINSTFNGNGSTTTFQLPSAGVQANTLNVSVGGVVQTRGTHYTLTDNAYPTNDAIVFSSVKRNAMTFTGDGVATTHDMPEDNTAIASISVAGVALTNTDYTLVVGAGAGGADQISFTVAPTGAVVVEYTVSAPQVGDTITVTAQALPTIPGATFSAGTDNVGCSLQKTYELLDEAYTELETTRADFVFVDGAILDAANIADGSTATNRLTYFRKVETAGVVTYFWSDAKTVYQAGTGTTTDIGAADKDSNGQPIVKEQYHEVNFAHQLGTWAHNITANDRFVLGVLGTSQPTANTRYAVATWIGTLPQTDAFGAITVNGTGLLGNKFMSGTRTRSEGFFLTDSGFPDGRTQYDAGGAAIDLGKYLSIVATPLVVDSKQVNSAAVYTGMVSSTNVGESTTNKLINNVTLPFTVKKNKLDELSYAGYVTFAEKTRGVTVVSGELPTASASDYQYVSTPLIIKQLVQNLRAVSEPYIGKGLSEIQISALNTAVEGVFEKAAKEGWIVAYKFSLISTATMKVKGQVDLQMTVVPVFELREINGSLKLAASV